MNEIWRYSVKGPGREQPASPEQPAGVRAGTSVPASSQGEQELGAGTRPLPHTRPSSCQPPGTAQQALWLWEEQRWPWAAGEGQGWVHRVRLGCGEIGRSQ